MGVVSLLLSHDVGHDAVEVGGIASIWSRPVVRGWRPRGLIGAVISVVHPVDHAASWTAYCVRVQIYVRLRHDHSVEIYMPPRSP